MHLDLNVAQALTFSVTAASSAVYAYGNRRGILSIHRFFPKLIALYASIQLLLLVFLVFNHAAFPLNLEAMESTVLVHVKRLLTGLPIYPEPASDYIALAYTPLYYIVSAPFTWIFGANLFSLRLVAILGLAGSTLMIFLAVRRASDSRWWGLIAAGIFAAAYRAMDTYLDNAHSDSWMLFCILLGCYLIEQNRSRTRNLAGVLLLVAAFWFKQPGALFAAAAVLYLTLRDGWRNSWLYWIVAGLSGPLPYLAAPFAFLGPRLHYFTWTIPRQWVEFSLDAIGRLLHYILTAYPVLALTSSVAAGYALVRSRLKTSIWYFLLPVAAFSGVTGALDSGSNNNVFITFGVWLIITGMIGLQQLTTRIPMIERRGLHLLALSISFVLLAYDPAPLIVSPQADAAYQELTAYVSSLDGSVYAPWLGELPVGNTLSPTAHWVPLTDLVRRPGVDIAGSDLIRQLLDPVIHPPGKAYILMNYPLETDAALGFLTEHYQLQTDLGDRFAALSTLPKRFNLAWPRYLYRYIP